MTIQHNGTILVNRSSNVEDTKMNINHGASWGLVLDGDGSGTDNHIMFNRSGGTRGYITSSSSSVSYSTTSDYRLKENVADVTDGIAKYSFVDEHSAGRLIDRDSLKPYLNKIKNAKALLVGGISLQAEPCGSSWQWLVEKVLGDCVIYFDTNIRPDFIDDKIKYIKRFERLTKIADIVKISEQDYSYLYGKEDFKKATAQWLENGVKLIVLTLGEKGVKAIYSEGQEINVGTEEVEVIDTIAAGDSFNAGLLYELDKQKMLDHEKLANIETSALIKALTFANQVASFTVTQKGANPPWMHQVK